MVKIGVILVVDAETFEVIFGNNLTLKRQHIYRDIYNQRGDHIIFSLTNQPLRCNYFGEIEVSKLHLTY